MKNVSLLIASFAVFCAANLNAGKSATTSPTEAEAKSHKTAAPKKPVAPKKPANKPINPFDIPYTPTTIY